MMEASDFVVDIGPGAGVHGGNIVNTCSFKDLLKGNQSLTTDYLKGIRKIQVPPNRRKGNGNKLVLSGASGHNLKNLKISIPLGTLTCVTGVSGSGKSSLINNTLYPILNALSLEMIL